MSDALPTPDLDPTGLLSIATPTPWPQPTPIFPSTRAGQLDVEDLPDIPTLPIIPILGLPTVTSMRWPWPAATNSPQPFGESTPFIRGDQLNAEIERSILAVTPSCWKPFDSSEPECKNFYAQYAPKWIVRCFPTEPDGDLPPMFPNLACVCPAAFRSSDGDEMGARACAEKICSGEDVQRAVDSVLAVRRISVEKCDCTRGYNFGLLWNGTTFVDVEGNTITYEPDQFELGEPKDFNVSNLKVSDCLAGATEPSRSTVAASAGETIQSWSVLRAVVMGLCVSSLLALCS